MITLNLTLVSINLKTHFQMSQSYKKIKGRV